MNSAEGKEIIAEQLQPYRSKPYDELIKMIDAEPITFEVTASSSAKYQIEIQAFWDGKPGQDVRVVGSIDDGGWRAFFPLTDSFIKTSDDQFVDE